MEYLFDIYQKRRLFIFNETKVRFELRDMAIIWRPSVAYPKQLWLGLIVDWVHETVYSPDQPLIANCLGFMGSEAQVLISKLSPNILFTYLPCIIL